MLRRDHGDLSANQFGRQRRQPVELILGPAVIDRHVLALDIAGVFQALAKCAQLVRHRIGRSWAREIRSPASPAAARSCASRRTGCARPSRSDRPWDRADRRSGRSSPSRGRGRHCSRRTSGCGAAIVLQQAGELGRADLHVVDRVAQQALVVEGARRSAWRRSARRPASPASGPWRGRSRPVGRIERALLAGDGVDQRRLDPRADRA